MNTRVELPAAREVCPTNTRRLIGEGALTVDVRELHEVAQVAFDARHRRGSVVVAFPGGSLRHHETVMSPTHESGDQHRTQRQRNALSMIASPTEFHLSFRVTEELAAMPADQEPVYLVPGTAPGAAAAR